MKIAIFVETYLGTGMSSVYKRVRISELIQDAYNKCLSMFARCQDSPHSYNGTTKALYLTTHAIHAICSFSLEKMNKADATMMSMF